MWCVWRRSPCHASSSSPCFRTEKEQSTVRSQVISDLPVLGVIAGLGAFAGGAFPFGSLRTVGSIQRPLIRQLAARPRQTGGSAAT